MNRIYLVLFTALLCSLLLHSNTSIKIIKQPAPNFSSSNHKTLKVIRKIEADFGADQFFVMPDSTVIIGNRLFVLDNVLVKIFIFDIDGNFIKAFGKIGQGPGEMSQRYMFKQLKASGNYLTVNDYTRRKIIFFDTEGNLAKEKKYPEAVKALIPSENNIDLWRGYVAHKKNSPYGLCKLDNEFRITESLLDFSNVYYLFNTPFITETNEKARYKNARLMDTPMLNNTSIIDFPDGTSLVYLHIPSHLYIFKKGKKVKDLNIWPARALNNIQSKISKLPEKERKSYNFPLSYIVPDYDTKHFYFSGVSGGKNISLIYEFNTGGELISTFEAHAPIFLSSKTKDRFYGLSNEAIYILKEENR